VTGGKPIDFYSQFSSDVNPVNPLVAFYDIHGRKGEVLFFCYVVSGTEHKNIRKTYRLFNETSSYFKIVRYRNWYPMSWLPELFLAYKF
jgi:hypothetical protein